MKPPSTVVLRLRGLMPAHLFMSLVAAVPVARIGYAYFVQHLPYPTREPLITAVVGAAGAVAVAVARLCARWPIAQSATTSPCTCAARRCPYKTIKELRVERGRRRTTLHLVRSEDIQLALVVWDAYAGRLQPIDVLSERLAAHGLTFDSA